MIVFSIRRWKKRGGCMRRNKQETKMEKEIDLVFDGTFDLQYSSCSLDWNLTDFKHRRFADRLCD
jgi:hypothetical protein